MDQRVAILVLNHVLDRHLIDHYRTLLRDCSDRYDVYLLSDRSQVSPSLSSLPRDGREFRFSTRDLNALDYPGKVADLSMQVGPRNMKLGNAELPVLLFARNHPEYQYYWIVEYDVRFSGRWRHFFAAFEHSDAALLGTSLARYPECSGWRWWDTIHLPDRSWDLQRALRGFFPVYRLSATAVSRMDAAYREGAEGHMEALMPTLLELQGLKLEDIGGDGPFVSPANRNRFYRNDRLSSDLSPGTFVYRPVLAESGSEPDMLWHPVKPPQSRMNYLMKRVLSRAGRIGAAS